MVAEAGQRTDVQGQPLGEKIICVLTRPGWRPRDRARGGAEPGRRSGLDDPPVVRERAPRLMMRVLRGLGQVEDRREADVPLALQPGAPLVPGALAEYRRQPFPGGRPLVLVAAGWQVVQAEAEHVDQAGV